MTTKEYFLKHERISFNQALLILNGESPTFDKYSDESFAIIFKPRKAVSEQIYKLRSEGNIELFEIEAKQYSEQIKAYNLLVAKYNDNTPTAPTIDTQEFLIWAISNKLLKEIKDTNQYDHTQNVKPTRKQRSSTEKTQIHINKIAKDLMTEYPELTKHHLSTDVAKLLLERHNKKLKPTTIERDYLKNHPDY
jgi:hypothetical protein